MSIFLHFDSQDIDLLSETSDSDSSTSVYSEVLSAFVTPPKNKRTSEHATPQPSESAGAQSTSRRMNITTGRIKFTFIFIDKVHNYIFCSAHLRKSLRARKIWISEITLAPQAVIQKKEENVDQHQPK